MGGGGLRMTFQTTSFPDPILKVRFTQSTRSVYKRKNRAQLLIVGKKNLAI